MISKATIELIYEAASIQRWNDHIRPWTGFTELDKQAHKMFYAYILAKCEGENVDMQKLVEGGIFEFFHRSVLTDIKPPIYHQLVKEKGRQIDDWVLGELKEELFNLRFQHAINQLENPMRLGDVKKEIAVIKTIMTEKNTDNGAEA